MAPRSLDVDDRPSTAPAPRWRLALGAAALVVLLAGCASVPSNTPEGYDDVTEANYLAACTEAGESEADCQCYYDGIVENVDFEDFKDFEDQVEADPTDVPRSYDTIVEDCAGPRGTSPPGDEGDAGDGTTTTRAPS